jgi:hypothetical protein
MATSITADDLQQLAEAFPDLNYSKTSNCVWGTLPFACSFNPERREVLYSPEAEAYIEDSYEIRIVFDKTDTFGFPSVFEDSQRIVTAYKNKTIIEKNRHFELGDGCCCLGIYPEYVWTGIVNYIYDKVIPFFYWHSYLEQNGKPPWPGYTHANDGLKEAMTMEHKNVNKGRSRNQPCPCKSGKKYKRCCQHRDSILASKIKKQPLRKR